jgi:hypothetical protein
MDLGLGLGLRFTLELWSSGRVGEGLRVTVRGEIMAVMADHNFCVFKM